MRLAGFGELACGSNGGAPRQPLDGWSAFHKCRPENNGLYEVYARFDDEDEYIGRAVDDPAYARGKGGTRLAGHPVILSVLFDRDGVVRALRLVTDPRAASHERRMAHLLRLAVLNRYDHDGWTCTDAAPAEGETAVGGVFVKQRCDKLIPGRHLFLEARFLRKPGQADADPRTGEYKAGQFESWTRFEIFEPGFRIACSPDEAKRNPGTRPRSPYPAFRCAPCGLPTHRGNGMNPSRFGIRTFGSDCASTTSVAAITPLRWRM